jgi:hypothetical protein
MLEKIVRIAVISFYFVLFFIFCLSVIVTTVSHLQCRLHHKMLMLILMKRESEVMPLSHSRHLHAGAVPL